MAGQSKELYVERAYSKLHVPTQAGEHIYMHPCFGPANYQNLGKQMLQAGFAVPTGDATTPLVHAAYCLSQEKEFADVKDAVRNRWFYVFDQDVWAASGLYVILDTKAEGLSKTHSVSALEKRLKGGRELSWGGIRFSKDNSVRFAPKGSYTLGEHTATSLAKDGAVIVQYGVEGVQLLGEVIKNIKKPAITSGLEIKKGQASVQRVSTLCEYDDALHLVGDCDCFGGDGGVGFGVFESPRSKKE